MKSARSPRKCRVAPVERPGHDTTPLTSSTTAPHHNSLRFAVRDVLTLARRNLLALVRIPTALVFMVIQPVMFVLLFRYVFGALGSFVPAVSTSTTSYRISCRRRFSVRSVPRSDWPKTCSEVSSNDSRRSRWPEWRCSVDGRSPTPPATFWCSSSSRRGLPGRLPSGGGFFDYIAACLVMLLFAYCLSWGSPSSAWPRRTPRPPGDDVSPHLPLTFASTIFIPLYNCRIGCRVSRTINREPSDRRRSKSDARLPSVTTCGCR